MTIKEFLIAEKANTNYPSDILEDTVRELYLHFEKIKSAKGKKKLITIYTDINYQYRYYEVGKQLIKL